MKVLIKTFGCDIYPHGTIHEVEVLPDGRYKVVGREDYIPIEWCEEVSGTLSEYKTHDGFTIGVMSKVFTVIDSIGLGSIIENVIILNTFHRLGYDHTGRIGHFNESEYQEFEQYCKEKNFKW